jgi:hypothetical protein
MSVSGESVPEYDNHDRIIVMPHQVLDQVVDNAHCLEDQANQSGMLMDETLRLCLETQELLAQLNCRPSQSAFEELQAQVATLTCFTSLLPFLQSMQL